MKRRIITWLVLAMMILVAAPAALAGTDGRVEDFTVETVDSVITVIPPAGYAEKGYYKLFWKNSLTGDVKNAVFPVDTPAYQIEAEEGANYSLALFYAKRRGGLPAAWKGDEPEEATKGPSVWKVLWIDAETVEYKGIINRLSEANRRTSEEASKAFEALVEDLTGGLVDIQVTRMTLEAPVTSLTYDPEWGYAIPESAVNVKRYALHKYDSVFVFARMDGIFIKYSGVATEPENARDEPGYSVLPLVGDDNIQLGDQKMEYVCVHEWIHQLSYFYGWFQLEIPNPDEPQKYGYDAAASLDPQFFRDVLTMNVHTEDGRSVGVPAEAWQYNPTHMPPKWNLSGLQEPKPPAAQEEETAAAAETVEEESGETEESGIYGIINPEEFRSENPALGLGCVMEGWELYSKGEYPYTVESSSSGEDAGSAVNSNSVCVFYARNTELPEFSDLWISSLPVSPAAENDEMTNILRLMQWNEEQLIMDGWEDFSSEIVERKIGSRTVYGIKMHYTCYMVPTYILELTWFDGDHMYFLSAASYMFDTCDSILQHYYPLDEF